MWLCNLLKFESYCLKCDIYFKYEYFIYMQENANFNIHSIDIVVTISTILYEWN